MKMFFNHRLSRTTLTRGLAAASQFALRAYPTRPLRGGRINVRVGGARTLAALDTPMLAWRLFDETNCKCKLLTMLVCMLCVCSVNATTWYVDATNGSDANTGTSSETALATIQSAVDKASSGDEVLVNDGTYSSFSILRGSVYLALNVRSVNGPYKTTIDGDVLLGNSNDYPVYGSGFFNPHHATIERFTIRGSFPVSGGYVRKCIVTGGRGNQICKSCIIYDSIFYGNVVLGNDVPEEFAYCKLYNCTVYENHGSRLTSGTSAFYNCILCGDNTKPTDAYGSPSSMYNCHTDDPKFINVEANDFRLLSISPCIDNGNNSYASSDDKDIAGMPRINGGTVDIGAYEYYPAGCTLSNVSCRQRYPWNGKVDVNFSLSGSDDVQYAVKLEVEDLVGGTNLPMRTVSKKGGAAVNRNGEFVYPGAHRWVWDAGADLPDGFESERVVVKVNSLDDATSTYTVRFNANGGKGTMENEVYVYGIESTLPPNRFSFDGCEFQGWAAIIGGSRFFSDGDRIFNLTDTNKKVIDLYAIWKPIDHTRLYMVIDLSAGADAEAYSISYLAAIPDGGWTDEYKTTKLVLRRIEPGTFKMCGQYNVTLTRPFYIGVFEVTQKQYELLTGVNPSYWGKGDTRPVACLTYYGLRGESEGQGWPASSAVDSTSVLGKLRSRTGLDFDLPTEAQWEYACRAGTTSTYNNGGDSEDDLKTVGRYIKNASDGNGGNGGYSSSYAVVGSYLPNAWGLYDMHGNVHEWCLDRCTQALNGLADDMIDPKGIETSDGGEVHMRLRIVRGGSFHRDAASCSSGQRRWDTEGGTNSYYDYGLRLCLPL